MVKVLIVAASLGFSLSAAGACEYMRSVKADVDQTVVASVVTDEQRPMSTPIILPEEAAPAAETGKVVE